MKAMRLHRALLLLTIGTAIAFGVLTVSFRSLAQAREFSGCPGIASDGQVDPYDTVAFWNDQPVPALTSLSENLTSKEKRVLGTSTGEKWIEVDLSDQKLTAHQGDQVFLESLVSTGLWGKTPAGEYSVWYKIRSTKMEGGSKANHSYYYLPNVPYAMFFKGDFGIHGTYWHQNFGQPMSHGCVNAPTPIAERLFYWADPQLPEGKLATRATPDNPGTRVVVHE